MGIQERLMNRAIAISSIQIVLALSFVFGAPQANSHHSFTRFNQAEIVEIEGELVSFRWRNPHIVFEVRGTNDAGDEMVWKIEGHSLSILRRTDASPERLEIGNRIRLAGWPTVRPSNEIFVHNMLLPDGTELLLQGGVAPRWRTGTTLGDEREWMIGGTETDNTGRDGLFRVWSTQFGPGNDPLWLDRYPLTEAAQEKLDEWDPITDTAAPGCQPKGMPLIMEQPYPIEFVRRDDVILLRIEEYDTVRKIHMTDGNPPGDPERSILGSSTGQWEQDTLVVRTVGVDFPLFDSKGTPQGSNPSFVERFRVSDDGSQLLYEMTANDSETFTSSVNLTRNWVWRPGEAVEPYDCVDAE
jgi:hypothetical protein